MNAEKNIRVGIVGAGANTRAAGKHVMCEARMAMNAAEARRMRDAARQHPDLVTQVVPSPFTLRVDKTIQRLIAEGYMNFTEAVARSMEQERAIAVS